MATKKQRRRRNKDRRHEWEYVYVDSEGEEVEVDEPEAGPRSPKKAEAKGRASGKPSQPRGGRTVQPPSWRRVGKRAVIFAPLMLVIVYLLQGKKHDYAAAVIQTVFLLAFFLPFSYLMDRMMYRSYRKRQGGDARATKR